MPACMMAPILQIPDSPKISVSFTWMILMMMFRDIIRRTDTANYTLRRIEGCMKHAQSPEKERSVKF